MLEMKELQEIFGEMVFLVKKYKEEEKIYDLNEAEKRLTHKTTIHREFIDVMSKKDLDCVDDTWKITRKGFFHMMYLPYFYSICKTTIEDV